MPTEIRYAVSRRVRNPKKQGLPETDWWQLQRDEFRSNWDTRKLFERTASALAVIWKHRDMDNTDCYKYTLHRVTRKTRTSPGTVSARDPQEVVG
jgi:hypothetical protein